MPINLTIIAGRLTRDPELKFGASGIEICTTSIAHNYTQGTGDQKKEITTFLDCTLFGKSAKLLSETLHKGSPVEFEGRLQLDQWESENGQRRSKHVLIVNRFHYVGTREENAQSQEEAPQQEARSQEPQSQETRSQEAPIRGFEDEDPLTSEEDIPF